MEIYLDENLSKYVAEALNLLSKGYFQNIQVLSTIEKFGKSATDETIIPAVGNVNGILITRDIQISRSQLQFDLCKEFKIGILFLHLEKGSDRHWDLVRLLINHWQGIVNLSINERRPFAFKVKVKGRMEKLK